MNHAEKHFRELLADAPFNGSYRSEHRDQVRELALRAFDEAAAVAPLATVSLGDATRRRLSRRPAVWMAVAAAAASVGGALLAWNGRSNDGSSSNKASNQTAFTQSDALALADQKLVAALDLLSAFDEEGAATTYDLGVQVCLGERYSQIASMGQRALGARDQRD